jgi:hypothetical protein
MERVWKKQATFNRLRNSVRWECWINDRTSTVHTLTHTFSHIMLKEAFEWISRFVSWGLLLKSLPEPDNHYWGLCSLSIVILSFLQNMSLHILYFSILLHSLTLNICSFVRQCNTFTSQTLSRHNKHNIRRSTCLPHGWQHHIGKKLA